MIRLVYQLHIWSETRHTLVIFVATQLHYSVDLVAKMFLLSARSISYNSGEKGMSFAILKFGFVGDIARGDSSTKSSDHDLVQSLSGISPQCSSACVRFVSSTSKDDVQMLYRKASNAEPARIAGL